MELKAVVESLKKILHIKNANTINFELFSDSAYVVNAINNKWVDKWKSNGWKTTKLDDVKNRDLWEEFCLLNNKLIKQNISLSIVKIKGHSGNTFNELVDKVAKEETSQAKLIC